MFVYILTKILILSAHNIKLQTQQEPTHLYGEVLLVIPILWKI